MRLLLAGWLLLLQVGMAQPAPDFALPDRWGNLLRLQDFQGRPTLIAFFAYWCDTWKPLLSDLQQLRRRLGAHAPQVIWVAVDGRQHEEARRLLEQARVPYPVVTDYRREVAALYSVSVVPTLIVIDAQGRLQKRYQGFPGQAALLQEFQPSGPTPGRVDYSTMPGYLLDEERSLWRLLGEERQKRGLPPLQLQSQLTDVAREYVQRLQERGDLSHLGPESPTQRVRRAHLEVGQLGEILLQAHQARAALAALMASPSHKQILLHSHFQAAGLGAIRDGSDGWIYCLLLKGR